MNIPIVFEDESLIIIDKPAGIVVNRSLNSPHDTVQDWAEKKLNFKDQRSKIEKGEESTFYGRAGIVHRLDKETSGILLIAKNEKNFLHLQNQFFSRTVQKEYITLVHGNVLSSNAEINAPVGRLPWDRMKFGVLPGGREASTSYSVIERFDFRNSQYSLLTVLPHTGRTHQIRIHLKHIGHSIVGDYLYAGRKTYRQDKEFCNRIFLHAGRIRFIHPEKNVVMEFSTVLPEDLVDVVSDMRGDNKTS
jgi:23S rRNA pseudouridine1911/1915/1917 synthase